MLRAVLCILALGVYTTGAFHAPQQLTVGRSRPTEQKKSTTELFSDPAGFYDGLPMMNAAYGQGYGGSAYGPFRSGYGAGGGFGPMQAAMQAGGYGPMQAASYGPMQGGYGPMQGGYGPMQGSYGRRPSAIERRQGYGARDRSVYPSGYFNGPYGQAYGQQYGQGYGRVDGQGYGRDGLAGWRNQNGYGRPVGVPPLGYGPMGNRRLSAHERRAMNGQGGFPAMEGMGAYSGGGYSSGNYGQQRGGPGYTPQDQLHSLNMQLQRLVEAKKYEEAQDLKDQIDKMEGALREISVLSSKQQESERAGDFRACAEIQKMIEDLQVLFRQSPTRNSGNYRAGSSSFREGNENDRYGDINYGGSGYTPSQRPLVLTENVRRDNNKWGNNGVPW